MRDMSPPSCRARSSIRSTIGTTELEYQSWLGDACAIDLFKELGELPNAQVPYLAVLITLVPSSNSQQAPTMTGWDITYSCPFNQ